jgi:16S rRNA (uracil1498-N3)-methyltransferase
MRVFVLPEKALAERQTEISGKDFHYLARVLRVKAGEQFLGTDGRGRFRRCTVGRIGRRSLELRLEKALPAAFPDPEAQEPRICLIQCLPKGRKMDLIVRQATEAGVVRLIPVFSRFSGHRIEESSETKRACDRWLRIAREALQQSGAALSPVIEGPVKLEAAVELLAAPQAEEARLVFHPRRIAGSDTLHRSLSKNQKNVTLVVGPEGGLADQEIALLRSRGFVPVTLSSTVLRTETAALYAIAAVQAVTHERQTWKLT